MKNCTVLHWSSEPMWTGIVSYGLNKYLRCWNFELWHLWLMTLNHRSYQPMSISLKNFKSDPSTQEFDFLKHSTQTVNKSKRKRWDLEDRFVRILNNWALKTWLNFLLELHIWLTDDALILISFCNLVRWFLAIFFESRFPQERLSLRAKKWASITRNS